MSDQTPWQDPRYRRPGPPQPPPYLHGRHPVPPPVCGPPVTAVPYAVRRRRVHPLAVVGLVLGGAALLCCGVGTVGALVDGGDPKGSTALPVADATVEPAESTPAAEPDLTTAPPSPAVSTAPPTSAAPPPSAKPKVTTKPPATTRPPAPRTTAPKPRTTTKPAGNCDPSYPTLCIPPGAADLDCGDIPQKRFPVRQPDPHDFDGNKDGVGCES
ncbi:hypothetical protein [Phytohabitans houttuyneae]|uniref:Excalibur calcium-binding domain-containing protein n=1 Tax=Phytohabitans houttuyneae TaxID=1076126 RepID=A0A6V8KLG0_9ACTN|nr:hypothetical protein [Phytohabitans houttuyneae]GFJ82587.1 hypothetical protein Phou_067670 [Phytohabitans houttuyneae]